MRAHETTHHVQFVPGSEFKRRAAEVVANPFLKKSFRGEHLATFLWHNTEKNEGSKA